MLQLHRSLGFWAGILVMVFVCWAWWDSMGNSSSLVVRGIRYEHQYGMCGISGLANRPVAMSWSSWVPKTARHGTEKASRYGTDKVIEPQLFMPPVLLRGGGAERSPASYSANIGQAKTRLDLIKVGVNYWPIGSWSLVVPHWLILLGVAVLWLLLLVWRARRRRRRAMGG